MIHEVLRAVAGFMNSYEGGTLIIGIADEHRAPKGLDRDIRLIPGKSLDTFMQRLTTKLNEGLTKTSALFARAQFEKVDEIDVCRIDVRPGNKQVFVNGDAGETRDEFFVRQNNSTHRLSAAEMVEYAKDRWPPQ